MSQIVKSTQRNAAGAEPFESVAEETAAQAGREGTNAAWTSADAPRSKEPAASAQLKPKEPALAANPDTVTCLTVRPNAKTRRDFAAGIPGRRAHRLVPGRRSADVTFMHAGRASA